MVELVAEMANYARTIGGKPDFIVLAHNGERLSPYPEFTSAVTGIVREAVYYGYEAEDRPTPPEVTRFLERQLDPWLALGKPVLTLDYVTELRKVSSAYQRARSRGYVPFCTSRDLTQLVLNPGYEPD